MDPMTETLIAIATEVPSLAVLAWVVKMFLRDRRTQNERCHEVTASATKALAENTAVLRDLRFQLRGAGEPAAPRVAV